MDVVNLTFNVHIKLWKVIGIYPIKYRNRSHEVIHQILVAILYSAILFYYPFSMIIALANQTSTSFKELIDNVSIAAALTAIFLKNVFLRQRIQNFIKILSICCKLERKFNKQEFGRAEFESFGKKSREYLNFYAVSFSMTSSFVVLSMVLHPRDQLRFPAYFPFDVTSNSLVMTSVKIYQGVGWIIHACTSLFADTYPPILIYLLKQNVKILSKRISRIGYGESGREAHEKLRQAIDDNITLNQVFDLMNDLISPPMFTMFATVLVNLAATILLLNFFAETVAQYLYFGLYGAGVSLEIALACFYSSELEACNHDLVRAIYYCNWIEQSKQFRRDLIIFAENCLFKKQFTAGGIIPISLITFQKVLKTSYSFYTVLSQMTNK